MVSSSIYLPETPDAMDIQFLTRWLQAKLVIKLPNSNSGQRPVQLSAWLRVLSSCEVGPVAPRGEADSRAIQNINLDAKGFLVERYQLRACGNLDFVVGEGYA